MSGTVATRRGLSEIAPRRGLSGIVAVVPALDEVDSIAAVVRALLRPPVACVIVVDNGSRDGTADVARAAGAQVVFEPRRGYGAACQAGLRALPPDAGIVLFADGDGCDDLSRVPDLLAPITDGRADLVVAARDATEPGAFSPAQRAGNALACAWLRARYHLPATDLGPLRAIRRDALDALAMVDRDYGWTVEMQIKAARAGLRYAEVRVPYRARRAGHSKVSGTVRGTLGAAVKIVGLLLCYDLLRSPSRTTASR